MIACIQRSRYRTSHASELVEHMNVPYMYLTPDSSYFPVSTLLLLQGA